jgi:hypothetical protein
MPRLAVWRAVEGSAVPSAPNQCSIAGHVLLAHPIKARTNADFRSPKNLGVRHGFSRAEPGGPDEGFRGV